ncbi:MAG: YggT family protein [Ilumatobacteraceae bacterium]
MELLCQLVGLYQIAIVIRIVLSWFPTSQGFMATVQYWLTRITEPVLGPVRRALPPLGGLDLSPLVVLLFLSIVVQGLLLGC